MTLLLPVFWNSSASQDFSAFKDPELLQNTPASSGAAQVPHTRKKATLSPKSHHPTQPELTAQQDAVGVFLVRHPAQRVSQRSPAARAQKHQRPAGSAASSRRVLSEQATEASPLMELHMFAHSCSSWWRLESSESRLPNREESSLSPLWPNVQLVEEHPSGDQEPSICYKSPAPRSITGGKKNRPWACAGRGEAVEDQKGGA